MLLTPARNASAINYLFADSTNFEFLKGLFFEGMRP